MARRSTMPLDASIWRKRSRGSKSFLAAFRARAHASGGGRRVRVGGGREGSFTWPDLASRDRKCLVGRASLGGRVNSDLVRSVDDELVINL